MPSEDGTWAQGACCHFDDAARAAEAYRRGVASGSISVTVRNTDRELHAAAVEELRKLRDERDAYREALEEIDELCKRTEASDDKRRFSHTISSEIPALVDDVLTLHADPNPAPADLEELPF